MNFDDFEQRLRAQPLRPVPPEWRSEILGAAGMELKRDQVCVDRPSAAVRFRHWLRAWLWPSPLAWAGVTAAWFFVFFLNSAAQPAAGPGQIPSVNVAHVAAEWRQRYELMTELLETPAFTDPSSPPRPAVAPRRRSPDSTQTKENYESALQMA